MKEVAGMECGHSVGAAPGVALYSGVPTRWKSQQARDALTFKKKIK